MCEAFKWSFEEGADRTVVLGSDAPTLPATHTDLAFDLLGRSQIVLGPSTDGGYCLIGLSGPHPEVFSGIDWGSGSVFASTLGKAAGLALDLVPPWYDVDVAGDLVRLRSELTRLPDRALPHTRRTLQNITF